MLFDTLQQVRVPTPQTVTEISTKMGRTKNRSRKDQTAKAKDAAPFGESALTQQLSAASNAYTSGDFPGAKRICEAILNKAPNNITALEVLGTAELELDEPDLAKEVQILFQPLRSHT